MDIYQEGVKRLSSQVNAAFAILEAAGHVPFLRELVPFIICALSRDTQKHLGVFCTARDFLGGSMPVGLAH